MRIIISIILVLFSLGCKAQIEIYNTSLTDTTLNILYNSYNKVKIYGIEDYTNINIVSNSRIEKTTYEPNSYHTYSYNFDKDTIKIYLKDSLIYQKIFECYDMPKPKIIYGKTEDTLLTIDELISNPQLNIIFPNCYYKNSYRIVFFEVDFYLNSTKKRIRKIDRNYKVKYKKINKLTKKANVIQQCRDSVYILTENGYDFSEIIKYKTTRVYGNCLNYAHLAIIETMNAGDKIVFYSLTIRSTDGCDRRLPPLTIYIK